MKIINEINHLNFLQSSQQRRIAFDDFSRNVQTERNYENYQKSLHTIVTRNASSRSLNRRRQEELKERELLEQMEQVRSKMTI